MRYSGFSNERKATRYVFKRKIRLRREHVYNPTQHRRRVWPSFQLLSDDSYFPFYTVGTFTEKRQRESEREEDLFSTFHTSSPLTFPPPTVLALPQESRFMSGWGLAPVSNIRAKRPDARRRKCRNKKLSRNLQVLAQHKAAAHTHTHTHTHTYYICVIVTMLQQERRRCSKISENSVLGLISCFQPNALVYYNFSYSSTCFEPYCAHHQEDLLYIHSIWFFMCHSSCVTVRCTGS